MSAYRRHLRERKDLLIVRAALERMTLQALACDLSPVAGIRQWISRRLGGSSSLPAGQLLRGALAPWLLRTLLGRWFGRSSTRGSGQQSALAAIVGLASLGMPKVAKWAGIAGMAWKLWQRFRPARSRSLKSRLR